MHPDVAKARSRKAVAHRRGDQAAIIEAGRDLAAAKIEDYIRRTVEAAPPLTVAQRDRLAVILRGGDARPLTAPAAAAAGRSR